MSVTFTFDNVSQIIDKSKPKILRQLKLDPLIWADLIADEVISPALNDSLNVKVLTEMEKVTELLDSIKRGPVKKFLNFCKIMKSHGKTQIIEAMEIDMSDVERQLGGNVTSSSSGANIPSSSSSSVAPATESQMATGPDFETRMMTIAQKVRDELSKDKVRLWDRTGIELNLNLRGLIDQWSIIEFVDMKGIMAKPTDPQRVEALFERLEKLPTGDLLLFARALHRTKQIHQLRTLTKADREFIGSGEDDDMKKKLKDLD